MVLKKKGYRVAITSAISKSSHTTIGSIFVDDTDLVAGKLNAGLLDIDQEVQNIQQSIK